MAMPGTRDAIRRHITPFDEADLEQDALTRQLGGNVPAIPNPRERAWFESGGKDPFDPLPEQTAMGGDQGRNTTMPVPDPNVPGGGATGGLPSTLPTRGNAGQLTGYPGELGRSMKHVFGSIASRYGNNRSSLAQIMNDPEFKQWFPNAKQLDDDEVDFGGQLSDFDEGVPVGLVDLMRGGDDAWQWIDQNYANDGGGAAGGAGGGAQGYGSSDLFNALMSNGGLEGNDTLERIQRELQALIHGQPSDLAQDSFLQAMR
jgi:hypothetical protein